MLSVNLVNGKKLTKLQAEAVAMMPEIVAASVAESGYVFKSAFDVAYLIENGLVEQNEGIVNEAGEFATRATEAGIAALNATVQTAPAETKVEEPKTERKVNMSFKIEKGIPVPKTTRGSARTSAYPFDSMEVGDSFFIAASEKHPEPEKSLASTISGATKRYDVADLDENGVQKTKSTRNPKTGEVKEGVPAMKHTRVFVIRAGEKDGVKGARVFRTL